MNDLRATTGAPITQDHAEAVNQLIGQLMFFLEINGCIETPRVTLDALINTAVNLSVRAGVTEGMSRHLAEVARLMVEHASSHPTRH